MQFNQEYQEKLQHAWEHFIKGSDHNYDYSFIRPVIYESWLRSRQYNVNPFEKITSILSSEEIAKTDK